MQVPDTSNDNDEIFATVSESQHVQGEGLGTGVRPRINPGS